MSDSGGGGGGLWFVDFIVDKVNNRRIKKYNRQSRGLEQYKSITADVLFPVDSYDESILISGGNLDERMRLSERIILNCAAQNRPMIILHIGNTGLEQLITQSGCGIAVSRYNRQFDAFTSFTLPEMFQVMTDSCTSKYDIKPAGRYIMQIINELLTARKQRPYFAACANMPLHQLPAEINNALSAKLISQDAASNMNSLLMMGQAEIPKIDSFFYDIKAQCGHIQTDKPGGTSILSAIKNNKILCVDINSSGNTLLLELIVNSINIAMNRGFEFNNICLEFKDGKIINATANDTERVNAVFDTDEAARYIGEFALGVNPYILEPMKDTLFDEKIAGSFHFTPGSSYDVAYNGNKSAIHWDLVCIQRPEYGGGEIYFDGKLVRKDGGLHSDRFGTS